MVQFDWVEKPSSHGMQIGLTSQVSGADLPVQRHEAGDRDGEIELPEDRPQVGQTAGEWVDCHTIYARAKHITSA
jgi:hypothetical protein